MTTTIFYKYKSHCKKNINYSFLGDTILTILIFAIMMIIVASPKKFTSGTVSGLKLFFFSVLPGLFPFMLLTKLLTELGVMFKFCGKLDKLSYKLFGTPGISIYAFLMSILSGYPIGAKIIADLYEKNLISEQDAKRMSIFCTTSGPIFVIGTVGAIMFNNFIFGIILYASHILSSLLLGIMYHLFTKKKNETKVINSEVKFIKQDNIVGMCVNETINSLFIVGAYITIFYLIAELLDFFKLFDLITVSLSPIFSKLHISTDYIRGLSYGIMEVTRGAKTLSTFSDRMSLVLASGILSFSGLSIIFQSMAFLKKAKIKTQSFIFAKFVHFIFSMILCFALSFIIIWWNKSLILNFIYSNFKFRAILPNNL